MEQGRNTVVTMAFVLILHLKVLLGTFKYYKEALQRHEDIQDSLRTTVSPTCCCASLRADLTYGTRPTTPWGKRQREQ